MTSSHKKIYISIRAEQIKEFHDKNNGHLLNKPYPIERAMETAERQLNYDLSNSGKLRVTLDELLLDSNEDCLKTFNYNTIKLAKQIIRQ
jgi:hypothetical protein